MHGSDVFNFSSIFPHFSTTMLLIHFMFFVLALAAPPEVTMPKNLTESSRCTRSEDWQAYAFLVEDCYTAIQRLYIEEVLKKPDAIYEFITIGTHPQTLHPRMRTPIEYTVREYCSVPAVSAVVGICLSARFQGKKQINIAVANKEEIKTHVHSPSLCSTGSDTESHCPDVEL